MRTIKKKKIGTLAKIRIAVFSTWLIVALLCFGVTPFAFRYSYAMRGYHAIGGEVLIPLIPFIFMPQFMNLSDILCGIAKRIMKKKHTRLYCAL